MMKEMSPTSIASSAQPTPEPVSRRRCRRVNGRTSRRSASEVRLGRAVSAMILIVGPPVPPSREMTPAQSRSARSFRTRGITSVPYSSMLRIIDSWDRVPVAYLRSKRPSPRVVIVSAIFAATRSGEPA